MEDQLTGEVRTYDHAAGNPCGDGDTLAFPDASSALSSLPEAPDPGAVASAGVEVEAPLPAKATAACLPGPRTLCLLAGRFRVEVDWQTPRTGESGAGRAVPGTDETGYFWFFGANNLELAVKVLDGRPFNDRFWVFYGSLTDVEYRLEVTDTQTGAIRVYDNPAGGICGGSDTAAFRDGS